MIVWVISLLAIALSAFVSLVYLARRDYLRWFVMTFLTILLFFVSVGILFGVVTTL